ncbi:hypothetical protein FGK63_10470 [Ruegeria sediminis]|uniref:AAA+ family ATPase n=1 Tax=Ruegeria sediminis TaxID=2583820 RepID=A0ABY2WYE3_9RHOB|nr:hypothetical protein [Ruegeria sediminis]TMV07874.1 hypothetical protein FGK63_10470 [Ruegeria sediminis]
MKRFLAICAIAGLPALPAAAEEETGPSLMEQGAELFFEGLRQEMEPALDSLRGMAEEFGPSIRSFLEVMGPALAELATEVRDWSAYEAPEMLPNGDIIIRKKPQPEPDAPQDDGQNEGPEAPDGGTDI